MLPHMEVVDINRKDASRITSFLREDSNSAATDNFLGE